jgi:ANTAR domain
MLSGDLAVQAADLLKIADTSEARALDRLVSLAARQVPGCAGAEAAAWRDGEPVVAAASHPDLAGLTAIEHAAGRGPAILAIATDGPVNCPDTLAEERWPEYAAAALCRGVRCCVAIAHRGSGTAVTLSLSGARPRSMDPDSLPIAELLVALGGVMLGNVSDYGDSRRTALQLLDAAQARELVDQAKGMLMHALGCTAAEALTRLKHVSQQRNLKVTELAARLIDANGDIDI